MLRVGEDVQKGTGQGIMKSKLTLSKRVLLQSYFEGRTFRITCAFASAAGFVRNNTGKACSPNFRREQYAACIAILFCNPPGPGEDRL